MQNIIRASIIRLLRPLIRILLNHGIPYGTFAELARWTYMDVASKEFKIPGKKQTVSRISTITGLTRKEVKRLLDIEEPDDLGMSERYHRAARVMSGWLKDPRFTDAGNRPLDLPFEVGDNNFTALVRDYSGDIPPRAVLDELVRAGAVVIDNDKIRMQSRGYIVKQDNAEKLNIMGTDVGELISTFEHNIHQDSSAPFLQRKVSYDNLPEEALPEVRKITHEKGTEFIEEMDRLLSRYDRDVNPDEKGSGRRKAGIGVFYFE